MTKDMKRKEDRISVILHKMNSNQPVRINDLQAEMGVSRETIRRDLKTMEADGLVRCVYGGAVPVFNEASEYKYSLSKSSNLDEKHAMAEELLNYINDYDSLFILGSTTTEVFASLLKERNNLTVITNSYFITQLVGENPSNSVILLGGRYDFEINATIAENIDILLSQYRVDKAIFSCTGFSLKQGVTNRVNNYRTAIQTAMNISSKTFLLADSSKYGISGLYSVCPLDSLSYLICDTNLSDDVKAELKDHDINIVYADMD